MLTGLIFLDICGYRHSALGTRHLSNVFTLVGVVIQTRNKDESQVNYFVRLNADEKVNNFYSSIKKILEKQNKLVKDINDCSGFGNRETSISHN